MGARVFTFKSTEHFRQTYFSLSTRAKNTKKWKFFGIASILREKPETVEIALGQSQKLLYNQFAQDFAFLSACCRGRTLICTQAYVFCHLCTSSGK